MTSHSTKDHEKWKRMTEACERRRNALGLSLRGLSVKAGLEPSYYGHWLAKQFKFPSVEKMEQIENALDRLEALKKFEERLKSEADK
ncbi:helix-turn-helix transcriptional regulator [Leisingera sp. M527]|uniref:helix-turn-helix domain-containing protein n=1 Tax=Leisingera sp. M527 TaxID=2867014 RepID=UPI0021A6E580|nr:helix-turn-helix transcriptional regulator [Leisingera sp. M527]UWQ34600.1 helix-turn-helix transcriptional regulator [Leisingera sp. M527]